VDFARVDFARVERALLPAALTLIARPAPAAQPPAFEKPLAAPWKSGASAPRQPRKRCGLQPPRNPAGSNPCHSVITPVIPSKARNLLPASISSTPASIEKPPSGAARKIAPYHAS